MRTILNKKQKQDFLNDNWKFETLTFKWSRSGVCRIYDKRNNKTEFVAGGGGYDKKGSVLGAFINTYFNNELKKINLKDFFKIVNLEESEDFESVKGDAETLAGLLLEIAKKFPKKKQVISYSNYSFSIEEIDEMRITQVKVMLPKQKK